jgi:Ni,Fe-hydrogenase maturation factor
MKVYVFGNEDVKEDNVAFEVAEKLKKEFSKIEFVKIKPNEDLPFTNEKFVIILDAILGIEEVVEILDLNNLVISESTTVHDFDLGFQLKYLKKIGRLGKVVIIGLPMTEANIDYLRIHSILRKLVAHDMHGS